MFPFSESDDEKTSISVILNNEESIIDLIEDSNTVSNYIVTHGIHVLSIRYKTKRQLPGPDTRHSFIAFCFVYLLILFFLSFFFFFFFFYFLVPFYRPSPFRPSPF